MPMERSFTHEQRLEPAGAPEGIAPCSACGALGYRFDRFCACCGIEMPRRCRTCGAGMLHKLANYCTQCGAPVSPDIQREKGAS
jgi:hypothetical protein